jgi:hypothetical protein
LLLVSTALGGAREVVDKISGSDALDRRLLASAGALWACSVDQIRGVKIVFAGDPDEREKRIAPRVGQGCAHAVRCGRFGNGAYRPLGRGIIRGRSARGLHPELLIANVLIGFVS